MAKRDYYDVLGLPKTASADDIKSAYRRLVRQYHPDVAKENPKAAEEKFKEVSEAYEVLADPEKRRRYDQMGFQGVETDFGPGGFSWQNFTHAGDLEDLIGQSPLFEQLFANFGMPFAGGRSAGRGRDVEVGVRLPIAAALHGARPTVEVPQTTPCPDCRGTGARGGTAFETCPDCNGSGRVRRVQNRGYSQFITVGACPRCNGTGRRILDRCPTCAGSGLRRTVERIEITVPPGVEDGAVFRVPGHGALERAGGRPGDLFVQVLLEMPPEFRRDGTDVFSEATIALPIALLGGEVTIPTLDGHASLKVPAGTQPETQFRLKGNGFPRLGRSGRGDLLVTVHVEIPRALSGHEKDLVREALGTGAKGAATRRESLFRRRG